MRKAVQSRDPGANEFGLASGRKSAREWCVRFVLDFIVYLLIAMLVNGLTGCRLLPSRDSSTTLSSDVSANSSSETARSTTLPVGLVQHVSPEGDFILIRSSRLIQVEPGTILTVYGESGQAVGHVRVSPERKGSFLTADIVDGTIRNGNQVTMDYTPPSKTEEGISNASDGGSGRDVQILE